MRFVGLFLTVIAAFLLPTAVCSQTALWTVYDTSNSGLPYNDINALAIDAQGAVWIGTGNWGSFEGGGLAQFDGENWTVYNTSNSELPHNDHNGLALDAQGNIWCATEGGLAVFDGENWAVYTTENSELPHRQVHGRPVFDAQSNAWLPTLGGGLAKFDGENWTVYNSGNSGLPNDNVVPLAFDAEGNLWIGNVAIAYGPSLARFDGENWMVYTTENSGLPGFPWALAFDTQGSLWIGTLGGGLAQFDGEDWTIYNTSNSGLPANDIFALAFDAQGDLWIGTGHPYHDGSGLARFDGRNWTIYDTSNSGLPHNTVSALAFDARGDLWIGTRGGGLAVYRGTAAPPSPTAVEEMSEAGVVPRGYTLSQNVPNPFNPITTIAYDLPQASDVALTIYSVTGQKVARLVSAHQEAGHYTVMWDGSGFASGIYLYRLEAGRFAQTRKALLLR